MTLWVMARSSVDDDHLLAARMQAAEWGDCQNDSDQDILFVKDVTAGIEAQDYPQPSSRNVEDEASFEDEDFKLAHEIFQAEKQGEDRDYDVLLVKDVTAGIEAFGDPLPSSRSVENEGSFEDEDFKLALQIFQAEKQDEDRDYQLALSLQDESENSEPRLHGTVGEASTLSVVDDSWEMCDPNPDIRELFIQYDGLFFDGKLAGIEVKWSPRMTL